MNSANDASGKPPGRLGDWLVFNDAKLKSQYDVEKPDGDTPARMPMSTLYEAYFDGALDLRADLVDFLRQRQHFVKYRLTQDHLRWAVTNFVPEVTIHTRARDERMVREHYDRGNEFFQAFLGERMAYTSALFRQRGDSLEQAQDQQLENLARKLRLEPGDRLLDLGCGFGGFTRYAARHHDVDATGVTISMNETEYGNQRIDQEGLEGRAQILCADYRELSDLKVRPFTKIACVEMVEHVGVKNLVGFFESLRQLLSDDGLLLLQWTGLRRSLEPEDLIWGLFMNRYIYPGADASLPPSAMLRATEKAGFELHHVENQSVHFTWTLRRWYDNWLQNRELVVARFGERWFRVWHFFLAWSRLVGEQGSAASFQVLLHKNLDGFDRERFAPDHPPSPSARPEPPRPSQPQTWAAE